MARKEKELHMQLYPGWSARDSYAKHTKRKKGKKLPISTDAMATGIVWIFWSF
jgi:hypothetical protein